MALFNVLKQIDVYRDIPKDLTDQTLTGGFVSLVAGVTMMYLFIAEFWLFLTPETTHTMFIDSVMDTHGYAMLQININLTMPMMPCIVTSVDAQDVMGSHVVNVGGKLYKTRLDSNGRIKLGVNGLPLPDQSPPKEQIGEGCNVHGTIVVKRVPGNFHVSAHAHAELLSMFFENRQLNVSHIVHEVSFGDSAGLVDVAGSSVNPLRGAFKNGALDAAHGEVSGNGFAKSYEYFISIVPTQYEKIGAPVVNSYQYVANSNDILGRYKIPAVYFRYEISPVTVKFTQSRRSFSHFIVQVCAIVGGVFTVLGIVNSMAQGGIRRYKKVQLNKLG